MKVLPVLLLLMLAAGCSSKEIPSYSETIEEQVSNATDLGVYAFPEGQYCCLHSYMIEGEMFCNIDDVIEDDNCSNTNQR